MMSRIAECRAKALGSWVRSACPHTHVRPSKRDASPAWSQVPLQPSPVPWGLCTQPEVVKRAVLKISVENGQLENFSLHFHNFFTWHLLEGEYYWRDIYFLNVYQSMKKFITWEHLLFLRNMDPSTESKCWRRLCKWNHSPRPPGKSF